MAAACLGLSWSSSLRAAFHCSSNSSCREHHNFVATLRQAQAGQAGATALAPLLQVTAQSAASASEQLLYSKTTKFPSN